VNPISGSRDLTGKLREYQGNHALELVGWSNTRWTAEHHQMIQRFLTLSEPISNVLSESTDSKTPQMLSVIELRDLLIFKKC